MSSFLVQSGNFEYTFGFQPKTGIDIWAFSLCYESGVPSLFTNPTQVQVFSGESGAGYSTALNGRYLFLSNPESGHVEVYDNSGIIFPGIEKRYEKINRITGELAGYSRGNFGKGVTAVNGVVAISDSRATLNSQPEVGAVFYNQSFFTGGVGCTGANSFSQMGVVTGSIASGNFGSSIGLTNYNNGEIILAAGATGQNSGSGNAFVYGTAFDNLIQEIGPTGVGIKNFGKSMEFSDALSLKWLSIGSDHNGTGRIDIYKETSAGSKNFEFFQEILGRDSGDMLGYSIDSYGSSLAIGSPNLNSGSGVVDIYKYDNSLAEFVNSQTIAPAEREVGDNFGKSLSFNSDHGVVTSNNSSGKGYIFRNDQGSWSLISTVSGIYNNESGSFGGDISGSQAASFEGNVLVIGSSTGNLSYYFTTGESSTIEYTGFSISGSGGKLYDSNGHFVYGYGKGVDQIISGAVFTGGYYSMIAKDNILTSNSPRDPGDGLTGALNKWAMSGGDTLQDYFLKIYD